MSSLFSRKLNRFDASALTIIGLLIAATVITILSGDHVGVVVSDFSPSEVGASTSPVFIRFSQTMNRNSVLTHFQIQPSVVGTFDWRGTVLSFRPTEPLHPQTHYTITLQSGIEAESGRKLLEDFSFSFTVRNPHLTYLTPADNSAPANIWVTTLAEPIEKHQLTFSPSGITSLSASADGTQIAFAEQNGTSGLADIKLLDVSTGGIVQVTNCLDNRCENPAWSPSGNFVAYERIDFNSDFAKLQLPLSPARVWLADLTVSPPQTSQLFPDAQTLGYGPNWSANGKRLTVYDRGLPGVRIFDFGSRIQITLPSHYGVSGVLSPDGNQIILPEVAQDVMGTHSHLHIIDLATRKAIPLSTPTDLVDEQKAAWRPDGKAIVIARRDLTGDSFGNQLYLVDTATLQTRPLKMDANALNEFFYWSPDGSQIVIQRSVQDRFTTSPPGVWVYTLQTDTLTEVAANAFSPRWVP